MSPKLVFTDIDGTLLNHHQQVPDSARQAVEAAIANGHTLVMSTGRPLPEVYPWMFELGFHGFVGGGGSYARLGDEVLFEHFIEPADLQRAVSYFDRHGVDYVWQASDSLSTTPGFLSRLERASGPGTAAGHDWTALAEQFRAWAVFEPPVRASKAVFVCAETGDLDLNHVREEFADRFDVIRGSIDAFGPRNGELLMRGVNKGTALQAVADRLGVALEDTIALGDSDNDREMVQLAGVGVAMGNARNSLKAVADMVTADIDDDGFAKALAALGVISPEP